MHHLKIKCQNESMTTCYARLFYTLWSSKMPFSPLFVTYCRIDIFRVLGQSFCGKFKIVCGFWNPANPAFRMYGREQERGGGQVKPRASLVGFRRGNIPLKNEIFISSKQPLKHLSFLFVMQLLRRPISMHLVDDRVQL